MRRGYCQRWGCILPVGEGSEFGPGPVCMVCEQGLRPSSVPPDAVRARALRAVDEVEELVREWKGWEEA